MRRQRKVEWLETIRGDGSRALEIVVDKETFITVEKYGSGEATIAVRTIAEGYNPQATLNDLLCTPSDTTAISAELFGPALVWGEPLTIAHLVMDMIDNA